MIDVHSHIIPFVDDGSRSVDISLEMLREEEALGVTDVICTPHYRNGRYMTTDESVIAEFNKFKEKAKAENISVNLHLGREISCNEREKNAYIKSGKFLSLDDTYYVLLEFPFTEKTDIDEICYEVRLMGYIPVVAHLERYHYFHDYEAVAALRREGTLVQVNAPSISGDGVPKEVRFTKGLLKRQLVDLVGSDIHSTRYNYMGKAFSKLEKKNREYAIKIFKENPEALLNSKKRTI